MTALVSIIIPVYNVEDYIENCLNSLINQTYENIEIICVDDGSTDLSGDKIKSIKNSDNRIKYYYQSNQGVSSARNKGLSYANGEYVIFVDADDYLHYQSVEIFVSSIENTDYDMIFSHEIITDCLNEKMNPIKDFKCISSNENKLFDKYNDTVCGKSACFKIFKSGVAKSHSFPEKFSNGEDSYYNLMLINDGIKIGELDCGLYYYYKRNNSLSNSEFNLKQFSITECYDEICDKLKNSDNAFIKAYSLQYLYQTICYNRTNATGTEFEDFVLKKCRIIGNKYLKDFIQNNNISIKNKVMLLSFYFSRQIYELARLIKDPTMLDFYKNRRKRG